MLSLLLTAVVAFQAPQDTYADAAAADMVVKARAARQRNERLVTDYTVNVRQRIGVGVRAFRRDRMLFGQELAARIEWHRDAPSRVQVVGARERIPIATRGDQIPDDLDENVQWLVIDPAADYLRIAGDDAQDGFKHPLRDGSEGDYRFSSGDTTTLTLPDNRTVRLLELQVRARRSDFNLMNGSLWFDADSYGLVRAIFAPARPYDIELDSDSGDADDVPGMLKPIRGEVRYVTLEYGLYEFRWWMLRYFAIDVEAQASIMRVPVRFERTYEGYQVQGGSEPVPGARRPAGSVRNRERDSTRTSDTLTTAERDSIRQAIQDCVKQKADSAQAVLEAQRGRRGARIEVSTSSGRYRGMCRRQFRRDDDRWDVVITLPDDTASLLTSPELGAPILEMGDVMSENELRELGRDLGAIPVAAWRYQPDLPDGIGSIIKYMRYNRVEALSLGAAATIDWGRLTADGLFRIGIADGEPNFELGLTKPTRSSSFRLGAYRRLDAANPDTRPFGAINSFNALFLGRDDGEYFRTWGGELTAGNSGSGWWKARLYAEHQWAAAAETNASLPHLFNDVNVFRPNIAAQDADQFGGSLTLRGTRVLSRVASVGADLTVDGGTGTFDFGRGTLITRAMFTGMGRFSVGVEGAAGTSSGTVPVQSAFFLGGPHTLRGYDGNAMNGNAFWRGRGELGYGMPAVRFAVFSDLGWAGDRDLVSQGQPLVSAGFGVGFLDGILRMDLARRMRGQTGWRFDLYLDGIL